MPKVSIENLSLDMIGVYPPHWKEVPLTDVCSQVTDGTHDSPKEVEKGFPLVTGKAIKNRRIDFSIPYNISEEDHQKVIARSKPERDDILFTNIGNSIGDLVRVQSDLDFSIKNVALFKPNQDIINPRYLEYYLFSNQVQLFIKNSTKGSAQPFIGLASLRGFPVAVPPKSEQVYIAKMLGDLDDKIELNRQTNQTLEQIAQAIFKSWFVDFEPVKAKIEAKQEWSKRMTAKDGGNDEIAGANFVELAAICTISGKTEEQLKGLDEAALQQLKTTAALFPDVLVESELGEIPEGWKYSEIGNEVTVVGGGTPSTKNTGFWEGGHIHWTSPRDMSNLTDKILLDTDRKITEAGLAKISSGLLPKNTVLMSSRAPVGYLAIAKVPVAINQGYIAMKCESGLTPEYVVQWAESVMDNIKQRASGTTFAEISKKNFKIIPVVVPDSDLISEYSKTVSDLYSKITEEMLETKYLMEIRDTLLPKLLSGELELAG